MTLEASPERHRTTDNVCAFPDRNVAVSESNHRIANSLAVLASTINLRAARSRGAENALSHDDLARVLREISSRIVMIGDLHRLLSRDLKGGQIDINRHLQELCGSLIAALAPDEGVELVCSSSEECLIEAENATSVCLIVTEVVINSLKYAHPAGISGKLTVACRCAPDGFLSIEISDDGVGLPEGFDPATDGGLGSRTIRSLAQGLHAEASFESRPLGLRFTLRLPQDEPAAPAMGAANDRPALMLQPQS